MTVSILLQLVLVFPAQVAEISSTNSIEIAEATLVDAALVEMDGVLAEYQAQVASSDPLEAMSVLDAIGNVVLWKLEGYDISWSPQDQTLQVFLDGVAAPDVAVGIDAQGRQAFVIPLPDSEDFLTGWVDVDMVHNRVIMRSTSLPIDVFVAFAPNGDGTINLSPSVGLGCACVDAAGMFQWCTFSTNCNTLTLCSFGTRTGTCQFRAPRIGPPVIAPG